MVSNRWVAPRGGENVLRGARDFQGGHTAISKTSFANTNQNFCGRTVLDYAHMEVHLTGKNAGLQAPIQKVAPPAYFSCEFVHHIIQPNGLNSIENK